MPSFTAPAISAAPTAIQLPPTAAELSKRADIAKTSKDFEAAFLSVMLGQMFKDVNQQNAFSGGQGEDAFKSFMSDAMAKKIVATGGIGLSDSVQKEMLKLQGLGQDTP